MYSVAIDHDKVIVWWSLWIDTCNPGLVAELDTEAQRLQGYLFEKVIIPTLEYQIHKGSAFLGIKRRNNSPRWYEMGNANALTQYTLDKTIGRQSNLCNDREDGGRNTLRMVNQRTNPAPWATASHPMPGRGCDPSTGALGCPMWNCFATSSH